MKNFLKNVFRFLLWIIFAVIVFGGLYFICKYFDLPNETIAVAAILLLAVILGLVFGYRFLISRRRRQQIQTIVNLDNASIEDEHQENRVIENRWDRAITIMRQSYLGRLGNPIYTLPWYMVIGRSGAGKSSAVIHCGLNAMKTDLGSPEEISTQNCDWHFFREAVVMDTAGRYAVPLNEAQDLTEWRNFLSRLARYRKKETLNGLVIAVSSDSLYGNGEHLLDEARSLRSRIDEIMQILGHKFPIYLMITKIDLPFGMSKILEKLPEETQKQSLGIQIQSLEKDLLPIEIQTQQAINTLENRLKNFFLYSDPAPDETVASPHRLLAWEELHAMMPALRTYAQEIFSANPYKETPLFRGIFLSSAKRSQQTKSRAFPALSNLAERVFQTKEKPGGIFLRDFFQQVLPFDRNLNAPIAEYLRWRSSFRTIAYSVLLILTFGLNLLFYFSYEHNTRILNTLSYLPFASKNISISARITNYEDLYREEEKIDNDIRHSRLPLMGFNHAELAHKNYTAVLNSHFWQDVISTITPKQDEKRARLTEKSPDQEFFTLISDLVWKHDLLNAAAQNKPFEEMLKIPPMPQGIIQELGLEHSPQLMPAISYSMARSIYNIKNPLIIEQYLRRVHSSLVKVPSIKYNSFHWIIHRAGLLSELKPVRGSDFWTDSLGHKLHEIVLDPVYTKAGMKTTLEYLDNLNLIFNQDKNSPSNQEFLRWYANNYANEWLRFAHQFVEKGNQLAILPAREESLSIMASPFNPYYQLLKRMYLELADIKPYLNPVPNWMDDLAVFNRAMQIIENEDAAQTPTLKEKITSNAKSLYHNVVKKVDLEERKISIQAQLAADAAKELFKNMADLPRYGTHNDMAFIAIKDAMPSEKNPTSDESVLVEVFSAMSDMNAKLSPKGFKTLSPLYELSTAPVEFFKRRLINGAACHIQALWEGNVLEKAGNFTPAQLQQELFAEQTGIARKFADNTLSFILNKTLNGYEAEKLQGSAIPFTTDFIHFLNTGEKTYRKAREEYSINIVAKPTHVNHDAFEVPYAVELSLVCSANKQVLLNHNSPAKKLFNWKQNSCGDTNLTIRFKDLNLDIAYTGENGFINFLNDFKYGSKTFSANEFAQEKALLSQRGIRDITVNYQITGAEDLLSSRGFAPGSLPFTAAICHH